MPHAKVIFFFISMLILVARPEEGHAYRGNNGILPYRYMGTEAAGDDGIEYAKLVYFYALVEKNIKLQSPVDLLHDLRRAGRNPESSISADDLAFIGKRRSLDYLLLGTVTRKEGLFGVKSVIYSTRSGQVVDSCSLTASSLPELARRETARIFHMTGKRVQAPAKKIIDIAFLIDASQATRHQWDEIGRAVTDLAKYYFEAEGFSPRIWCIPYSSSVPVQRSVIAQSSHLPLEKWFRDTSPAGRAGEKSLGAAFSYALGTLKWREESKKHVIVINASRFQQLNYGTVASSLRARHISPNLVQLDSSRPDTNDQLLRLMAAAKGKTSYVTFHKAAYNLRGSRLFLYLNRGRIFTAPEDNISWHKGILRGDENYARAIPGFEEIFLSEKSGVNQNNFIDYFSRQTGIAILNSDKTVTNIEEVVSGLVSREPAKTETHAGKILITDGTMSLWIRADRQTMELMKKSDDFRFYPVQVFADTGNTYGMSLSVIPENYPNYLVPRIMKTDLKKLIALNMERHNRDYFFVNIKAVRIESSATEKDIRDED